MNEISFFVAFGAGFLSFISPCTVSLFPVYLASITGPGVLSPDVPHARLPVFISSSCFVLGFSTVFIFLGAVASLLGLTVARYTGLIRQISGTLLIGMGIFILLSFKVPALNFEIRFSPSGRLKNSYLRAFFTGAIFSLGWTPCVGPVLGGILTLAMGEATAWKGALLLAVFSLGLGLPFLLLGAFFEVLRPLLRKIGRYSRIIRLASAFLLIAVGVLVLTGKLALLSF